jgi:5-formyltetrahydrofolate cyclo-ligase
LLPKLREGTPRIGVCFSVQVVDDVPVEEHDVRVDVVVSERGVEGGRPSGD